MSAGGTMLSTDTFGKGGNERSEFQDYFHLIHQEDGSIVLF